MSPLTEPTKLTLAKGQPVPNDPYFAFNSLLLHGNGTNGSTVITDSSGSPKTVAPVGNAQISTAVADPFGNSTRGVLAFDGTGYLTIPASNAFVFGQGDFTIELFFYRLASGQQHFYDDRRDANGNVSTANKLLFYIDTSNFLSYYADGQVRISGSSGPSLNSWTHIAVSRASGSTRIFVNGSQTGSTYVDSTNYIGVGDSLTIGANSARVSSIVNGYIDELRITKGVARYTSNFTPPTAPFPDF